MKGGCLALLTSNNRLAGAVLEEQWVCRWEALILHLVTRQIRLYRRREHFLRHGVALHAAGQPALPCQTGMARQAKGWPARFF